jgi:hypothetical protein
VKLSDLKDYDYKYEAFIQISRLFEDNFREIEALIRNLRLFEDIFNGIEAI